MNQGPPAVASGVGTRSWVRGKDRRTAFSTLLSSLARSLRQQRDPEVIRKVFEHGIRHLLPFRRAELREAAGPPSPRAGPDVLSVEVPTSDSHRSVILNAQVEAGSRLGDWDQQVLVNLVHLGALVAEIEHLARGRAQSLQPGRGDGAAPLIGSSAVMCALRERIERVAATDFCVLIEGASGRM